MRRSLAFLIVCALCLFSSVSRAHGLRSAFVEIDEVEPGHATLHLRVSVPAAALSVSLGRACTLTAQDDASLSLDRTWTIACDDGALAGHDVSLQGLSPLVSDGVVWARYSDGSTHSHVLSKDEPSWTLPKTSGAAGVARDYVKLGVVHILTGYDHLLFLVLLVLALKSWRNVLLAETAFTASHSLSFTATALGWIHVSQNVAEACIALSLILVALDASKPGAPIPSRMAGAGLAFIFGLVHGLGFAGGLREIGLPEHDVATALVSFGIGVECGQVLFLAVVLIAVHYAKRARFWPRMSLAGAYASGATASFWLIQRLVVCFSPLWNR